MIARMSITERQEQILRAIIAEFMKNAEAVGSMKVVSQHDIGVSPATVRHEMVELADKGYLEKSHLSSGRVPTDLGLRYFVKELMEQRGLQNVDEVNVRIRVHKNRFDEEKLMSSVLSFLSEETGYASVSLLDNTLRYRGVSSLMEYNELRDVEVLEMLLTLLENSSLLKKLFGKYSTDDVCVIIGKESDIGGLRECSVVFSGFDYYGSRKGYFGVIGPRRMNYSKVIPVVGKISSMVGDAVRGW